MQDTFLVISGIGLFYFLFGLRKFDFFSVAFLSACVYFLPGFVGYTVTPISVAERSLVDLEDGTYLVMIMVLIAILSGALLVDHTPTRNAPTARLHGTDGSATWTLIIAVTGYLLSAVTAGEALLSDDKIAMMERLNRWHIIGATAAPLGAVLSFALKRWLLFGISMILLLFDLFIGFRVSLAVAMIAIFTLWLSRQGVQRLAIHNWKIGFTGLIVALFLFVYAHLSQAVKLGMWDVVVERLQDPDLYITAIGMSEPFNTQTILNEVIAQKFVVGMGHLKDVFYQFTLFSPELGVKLVSFNDLFQPILFPSDLDYGMANNIWAEMLSSGGWPLLTGFITIFVLVLVLGSYLIRSLDPTLAAGAALTFSYWAFYIHRNDLAYQINLEKRVILMLGICVVLCQIFRLRVFGTENKAIRKTRASEV